MKTFAQLIITFFISLTVLKQAALAQVVNITATPINPINPILNQLLSSTGNGIRVMLSSTQTVDIALLGRLERISSPGFIISVPVNFSPDNPIRLIARTPPVVLTNNLLQQSYGNFDVNRNIQFSGISFNDLKDGLNYKLPEGSYRLCFRARDYTNVQLLLSPEICVSFNICYQAGAPQFTQPVNNLNVTTSIPKVNPRSPMIFTWLPPRAICGSLFNALNSLRYDLEIREIFESQTITDAVNNPYVFRKTLLPSTTFLLDTNLYKNVLQEGKRYITRVRATVDRNSPVVIENFGYSRIEAFQYGDNAVVQTNAPSPEAYYIPFGERKSDFWDDALTAYKRTERPDTMVPVKEYIPLMLARNGLVYSFDAIELFLALNPELYLARTVKLSANPKLPDLPVVSAEKRKTFDSEHAQYLQPNALEANKYRTKVDSLALLLSNQSATDTTAGSLRPLLSLLTAFGQKADSINRVSMTLINDLLTELLYRLRPSPRSSDQPESLVQSIEELLTVSVNSTSFVLPNPVKKRSSLSSLKDPGKQPLFEAGRPAYLPPGMDALLSFDIIVFHYSKGQPPKPELNTGDLTSTFKVFYITSGLFNNKNPEINAKATTGPASTAQVSLPKTKFKFWTRNMFTNRLSKPQEVDLQDAFLNSRKRWPIPKNYSIVLKVD